jgi:DNA mismatch repair ATPase MutS
MGADGRIFIVTGPNQGGKTTYLQSIGLVQVLAQAGIFVPASRARISPVDGIFSHFPIEEKLARATGRFGDEAKRLNEIFEQATKHSFVLLNETFSSTNAGESRFLAEGILRILRMMGARVVFTTHMHELAEQVDNLNKFPGDSDLVSMVATVANKEAVDDLTKRTYKIIPSPPMGHSYAHEIAERYGISFEQLSSLLAKREDL